jgi:hypothetical protein
MMGANLNLVRKIAGGHFLDEAEERNKNRPQSRLQELFAKWQCTSTSCKNYAREGPGARYCFVQNGTHIEFDLLDANTWDRALVKGICTLELPNFSPNHIVTFPIL